MRIKERTFVALDYRLYLDSGEEVHRSPEGEPLSFVTGTGRLLPGLEAALMGLEAGERAMVVLEPREGYGEVSEDLFREVPKSRFPQGAAISEGMTFTAESPRGPVPLTVIKIEGDTVTVDLNHPLAGERLHFDIRVSEVREPGEEEMARTFPGCSCGCTRSEPEPGCGSGHGCP